MQWKNKKNKMIKWINIDYFFFFLVEVWVLVVVAGFFAFLAPILTPP